MSTPTLQDFRLKHRLRVRWAEIDLQRIVFNPHYLMYVDTAFTEYWRALAIPYEVIPQTLGGDLYVKKSTLEYHGSAHLDDLLSVGVRCQRVGNSSLQFVSGIFRDARLLVACELIYVFADPATQTSRPVPQLLRDILGAFEAGAEMLETRIGPWAELQAEAAPLRQTVLAAELGVEGLAEDALDPACEHLVLRNRLGQPLATGRLAPEGPGCSRIGRVAVLRAMRAAGMGRAVVEGLAALARHRGDARLVLNAQVEAQPFYERLGFQAIGPVVVEAGLPHQEMERVL